MEGMLKTHKLLLKNETSELCNYLSNWDNYEWLKRNLKILITYIMINILSFLHDIYILFYNYIKNEKIENNDISGEMNYNFKNLLNRCFKTVCLLYIF